MEVDKTGNYQSYVEQFSRACKGIYLRYNQQLQTSQQISDVALPALGLNQSTPTQDKLRQQRNHGLIGLSVAVVLWGVAWRVKSKEIRVGIAAFSLLPLSLGAKAYFKDRDLYLDLDDPATLAKVRQDALRMTSSFGSVSPGEHDFVGFVERLFQRKIVRGNGEISLIRSHELRKYQVFHDVFRQGETVPHVLVSSLGEHVMVLGSRYQTFQQGVSNQFNQDTSYAKSDQLRTQMEAGQTQLRADRQEREVQATDRESRERCSQNLKESDGWLTSGVAVWNRAGEAASHADSLAVAQQTKKVAGQMTALADQHFQRITKPDRVARDWALGEGKKIEADCRKWLNSRYVDLVQSYGAGGSVNLGAIQQFQQSGSYIPMSTPPQGPGGQPPPHGHPPSGEDQGGHGAGFQGGGLQDGPYYAPASQEWASGPPAAAAPVSTYPPFSGHGAQHEYGQSGDQVFASDFPAPVFTGDHQGGNGGYLQQHGYGQPGPSQYAHPSQPQPSAPVAEGGNWHGYESVNFPKEEETN